MAGRAQVRGWVRRLRGLSWARLGLLGEAALLLLAARVALAAVPARRVLEWKRGPRPGAGRGKADAVAWAVLAVARRSPVSFVCFPQCLAAAAMLRRRGVGSRLHYGVRREQGRLKTHTWLEAEGRILIGGEVAGEYAELAVY